jgi:hypothetical protein
MYLYASKICFQRRADLTTRQDDLRGQDNVGTGCCVGFTVRSIPPCSPPHNQLTVHKLGRAHISHRTNSTGLVLYFISATYSSRSASLRLLQLYSLSSTSPTVPPKPRTTFVLSTLSTLIIAHRRSNASQWANGWLLIFLCGL